MTKLDQSKLLGFRLVTQGAVLGAKNGGINKPDVSPLGPKTSIQKPPGMSVLGAKNGLDKPQ